MEALRSNAMMWVFLRGHILVCILVAVYIVANAHETGDDPWVWIPVILLFPVLGIGVFIIYRICRRAQDQEWNQQRIKADSAGRKRVSRRVSSEQELMENYYQGRRRKG